jgi:hypothetical protein
MPPQLSESIVLQRPAQVASVQHASLLVHVWPALQLVVPFTPQLTVWLQLFVTLPHWSEPHASCELSGMQPHAPLVQVWPPLQSGHVIMFPQLSVVGPQRLSHQWGSGEQMHRPSGAQPSPGAQVPLQFHETPHESTPGPQRFWQKVRSGEHASPGGESAAVASDASLPGGAVSSGLSCCVTSSPPLAESAATPVSLPASGPASFPTETSKPPMLPSPTLTSPSAASGNGIPSSIPRMPKHPVVPSARAPAIARNGASASVAEAKRFPRFIP